MVNNMIYEYYKYKLYLYIIGRKRKGTKNIKLVIHNCIIELSSFSYKTGLILKIYYKYGNLESTHYKIDIYKENCMGYDKFPNDINLRNILNDFK